MAYPIRALPTVNKPSHTPVTQYALVGRTEFELGSGARTIACLAVWNMLKAYPRGVHFFNIQARGLCSKPSPG